MLIMHRVHSGQAGKHTCPYETPVPGKVAVCAGVLPALYGRLLWVCSMAALHRLPWVSLPAAQAEKVSTAAQPVPDNVQVVVTFGIKVCPALFIHVMGAFVHAYMLVGFPYLALLNG